MTNQPKLHRKPWTGGLRNGRIGVLMLGFLVLNSLPTLCQSVKILISGKTGEIGPRSKRPRIAGGKWSYGAYQIMCPVGTGCYYIVNKTEPRHVGEVYYLPILHSDGYFTDDLFFWGYDAKYGWWIGLLKKELDSE